MSGVEKGNAFTGARALLLVEGIKVGYALNCSGGEELQVEPIEPLDQLEVAENVPTHYRVRFSMGMVRLVRDSLKKRGHFPKHGANSEEFLRNVLTSGELTVSVQDNQTGLPLMTLTEARCTSNNFNIDRGVVRTDTEWVGIRIKDETEI